MARNSSASEISTSSHVIWLSDVTPQDLPVIGLKALNLGVLQRLKLPVQPGFCITTRAYRRCLESFGISLEMPASMGFQEALQLGRLIQHSFFKYPLPVDILSEIRNAYRQLTQQQELAVVLRPSVPYPDPCFARRLRPMLNVKGMIEFEKALKVCWAYIWLDELIAYRFSQETLSKRLDDLAVIVQLFVLPRVSGSLISYNPASNYDQEMVIESAWGLNEGVTRGLLVPDQFIWQRFLKKVSRQQIVPKKIYLTVGEAGDLKQLPVPPAQQKQVSLSEAELLILSEMAEKALAGYKRPLELEWMKTERGFQLIQVHALQPPASVVVQDSEWERLDTSVSYFQQPFSPLGWSFLHPLLEQALHESAKYLGVTDLPHPAFHLNNYTVHWHHSIPKLLQQAFVHYQAQLQEQPHWKQMMKTVIFLWKAQGRWHDLYQAYLSGIRAFWEKDPAAGDREHLLAELDCLMDVVSSLLKAVCLLRLLNQAIKPVFAKLLQPYFQNQEHPPVYDILFQGLPGRKAIAYAHMDQLVAQIRSEPRLLTLFKTQQPPAVLWEQLHAQPDGQAFLLQIRDIFGCCGYYRTVLDPMYPSWVDSPQAILQELQQAIQHQRIFWEERVSVQRQELTQQIVETIGFWRLPDIVLIRILLHLSQACAMAEEDEAIYMSAFVPVLRRLMIALSRFLPLDVQQDIFYLELSEIRNLLETPINAFRIRELKELIQARKYERKIGQRLSGSPRHKLEALELQGIPAHLGQYLGRARVVLQREDLKALRQGEVLVTDYFEPAWEPALSKAGALIMELGGTLSHGAHLARKYQIPAIAGLSGATRQIKTGFILRLDGTTGQVSAYQAEVLEKQEEYLI